MENYSVMVFLLFNSTQMFFFNIK